MTKIKGRPKKAVIQEKSIGFYLTWKQYAIVQKKAEAAQVNMSDYMRQVALNAYVKARWTPEQQQAIRMLVGISADLHQLMLDSRERSATELEQAFLKYRDIIDEIIQLLHYER